MKKSEAILKANHNNHRMGNFKRGSFKGFYISKCISCGASIYRDSDGSYTGGATYTDCISNQELNAWARGEIENDNQN